MSGSVLLAWWIAGVAIGALGVVVLLYRRLRFIQGYHRELAAELGTVLRPDSPSDHLPDVESGDLRALARNIHTAVATIRDEREATAQEKGKLAGILGHISSGVMVIDRAGSIVLVNEAAERIFGLRQQDMVGRWHWEAGHHYGFASLIDEAMTKGIVQKREVQLRKPQEMTIETHITPTRHSTGAISGAVVLLHDVSEWRRAERMRSDFVANVSHELRTPITSLKGFAETLLDGAIEDQETARQFVQIMKDEADRLGRLVEDLLDLSKIEARHVELRLAPVNVLWMFQRVVDTFHGQAAAAGVAFVIRVGAEVAMEYDFQDRPILALANEDRLQQVLINLINNGLQFTPTGGTITLSAEITGDRVIVSVSDTGIGIPPAEVSRIFERFYRVDKARSRQSGGTGLGLAIVKHIVEAHGGRIGVQSKLGQGSRFFFDLAAAGEI